MASKTAQTEYRRMLRKKNMGKKARRVRNNQGSTPKFPVHVEKTEAKPQS